MGKPVWLDIGAGHIKQEGWISIDFEVERKDPRVVDNDKKARIRTDPDIVSDVRKIALPDGCADKARAIHVIEHLWPWESFDALREWVRLLKPGAELAIECPCLDKIIKLFDVPNVPPHLTMWGLYGDPRLHDPLMMHRWCFSMGQLERLMSQAGLVDIRAEPVEFHAYLRDMRLVGTKPADTPRIVLPTDQ